MRLFAEINIRGHDGARRDARLRADPPDGQARPDARPRPAARDHDAAASTRRAPCARRRSCRWGDRSRHRKRGRAQHSARSLPPHGLKPRYVFGEAWSIARSGPRPDGARRRPRRALALRSRACSRSSRRTSARLAPAGGDLRRRSSDARAGAPTRRAIARPARGRPARRRGPHRCRAKPRSSGSDGRIRIWARRSSDLNEAPVPADPRGAHAPRAAGRLGAVDRRGAPGVLAGRRDGGVRGRTSAAGSPTRVRILRGAGLLLGGVLVVAAILSVASAIRLALDLHREEIEIMRLMGATEAAIRAPFWLHAAARGARSEARSRSACSTRRTAAGSLLLARDAASDPVRLLGRVPRLARRCCSCPRSGCAAGFVGSLLSIGTARR